MLDVKGATARAMTHAHLPSICVSAALMAGVERGRIVLSLYRSVCPPPGASRRTALADHGRPPRGAIWPREMYPRRGKRGGRAIASEGRSPAPAAARR